MNMDKMVLGKFPATRYDFATFNKCQKTRKNMLSMLKLRWNSILWLSSWPSWSDQMTIGDSNDWFSHCGNQGGGISSIKVKVLYGSILIYYSDTVLWLSKYFKEVTHKSKKKIMQLWFPAKMRGAQNPLIQNLSMGVSNDWGPHTWHKSFYIWLLLMEEVYLLWDMTTGRFPMTPWMTLFPYEYEHHPLCPGWPANAPPSLLCLHCILLFFIDIGFYTLIFF